MNEHMARARALMEQLSAVPSEQDAAVLAEYPDVRTNLVGWLKAAAGAGAGETATELANLVGRLGASDPIWVEGAGPILNDLLRSPPSGLNEEDVVEVIGEIGAADAVETLFAVARRWRQRDAPSFWLSKKVLWSLSVIGNGEADEALRTMTGAEWPFAVRVLAIDELVHAGRMERQDGLGRLIDIFRACADLSVGDQTALLSTIEIIAALETPEAAAFVDSLTSDGWPQSVQDFARNLRRSQ